jgi:hypothetical protein
MCLDRPVCHWASGWIKVNPHDSASMKLEAEVGIEPTHRAFAEPCLTTWLLRPKINSC